MTDADALLAAILADPADDTVRLAYADHLDEHGEPERAAFIRVQVAMSRLSFEERVGTELPVRQVDLIVLHSREWVPHGWLVTANPECLEGVTRGAFALFDRGFADVVACDAELWLRDADAVLAAHPVRRVRLTTWPAVEALFYGGGAEYWLRLSRNVYAVPMPNPPAEVVLANLSAEWPGVAFELPPGGGERFDDLNDLPRRLQDAAARGVLREAAPEAARE